MLSFGRLIKLFKLAVKIKHQTKQPIPRERERDEEHFSRDQCGWCRAAAVS